MTRSSAPVEPQCGFGMIELLLAMALGVPIITALFAVFLSTQRSYALLDDSSRLDDSARYAIDSITRAVRQAGSSRLTAGGRNVAGTTPPSIIGFDARAVGGRSEGIDQPDAATVNGSDLLAVRFPGSGAGPHGDGSALNCAGFGVGKDVVDADGGAPGWSIFYVAADRSGEPELYCKYRGQHGWTAAAIARGVESFQILYGVGANPRELPQRFINATQLAEFVRVGASERSSVTGHTNDSEWHQVSEIRIAMLLRGAVPLRIDRQRLVYDLFGRSYGAAFGDSDRGTRINEADLPVSQRNRLRKTVYATIRLRNTSSEPLS